MHDPYDMTQPYIDYSSGFSDYHQYYEKDEKPVPNGYEKQFQMQQHGVPSRLGCVHCNSCPDAAWPQKYQLKVPSKERFSGGSGSGGSGSGGNISSWLSPNSSFSDQNMLLLVFILIIAVIVLCFKTLQSVEEVRKMVKKLDKKVDN